MANKWLRLDLDSGTRTLHDALILAKKVEVDLEITHKVEGRSRKVCQQSSFRVRNSGWQEGGSGWSAEG